MLNSGHKNVGYRPYPPVYRVIFEVNFLFSFSFLSICNLYINDFPAGSYSIFKNVWFRK